jgi:hypothetical protein
MSRIALFFPVFACLTGFQACSSSSSALSRQQIAAYSVATGFLTLCDDANYKNALYFAEPIKSQPGSKTWITQMQSKRAPFGIPIWRYWVNRQHGIESPKMEFEFRTSFSSEPLVDELVSVERISGQWQVYDYKYHALGKHPSPTPASKRPPGVPPHSLTPGASRSPSPSPYPSQPPLPATSP